ncbi:MAG: DUF2794 domain-containing protein [Sphingomonadaceae bacterium]|uniref:DUF2794 domain-containing protein n=1 Tax=Thermaurantiacus sp. TaxID=2820283 RepID=UPI00298F12E2|nr:DUF2794 domain-containing protein [Thermaurantiacus sp.]MCS6985856.1 DUF2794 domain-containing protein [Sphingomonadaceae bacterium]MDW8413875.1 DUF2794 domain-containing protein [Thermaurantiacus sp.]
MSLVRPLVRPPVVFERAELDLILGLYGRMVAAGLWRDYAIDLGPEAATFAAFRRAAERPDVRLVKSPRLRRRQGQYALLSESGFALKRGDDLAAVLAPVTRRLVKLVEA